MFLKTQPSINRIHICVSFTLFYAAFDKTCHSDENEISLKKFSTNYIIFLIYLHGSLSSFMIVLKAKQVTRFLLNLVKLLLLYHFMKVPPILIIEPLWTLKDLFRLPHKDAPIFLGSLMLLVFLSVTNLAPPISSKYAIQKLSYHWITKFGPP